MQNYIAQKRVTLVLQVLTIMHAACLVCLYREAIRLTSPQAGVGLYTNLGALLMGSGRIADCLTALQTGIDLAHEHQQTDSALVRCCSASACCLLQLSIRAHPAATSVKCLQVYHL